MTSTAVLTTAPEISNFTSTSSPALHDTSFIATSTTTLITSTETSSTTNTSNTFQTVSMFATIAKTSQTTGNSTHQIITSQEQTIYSIQPTNASNDEQILDVSSSINTEFQQSVRAMYSATDVYIIVGVTVGAVVVLVIVGLSIMFYRSRRKSNSKLARPSSVFDQNPIDSGFSTHNTKQNTYKLTNNTNSEMVANELYVSADVTNGMACDPESIYSKPINKQNGRNGQ